MADHAICGFSQISAALNETRSASVAGTPVGFDIVIIRQFDFLTARKRHWAGPAENPDAAPSAITAIAPRPQLMRALALMFFSPQSGCDRLEAFQRDIGRSKDGIAQRGRPGRRASFTDAPGRLAALDYMHFDLRR